MKFKKSIYGLVAMFFAFTMLFGPISKASANSYVMQQGYQNGYGYGYNYNAYPGTQNYPYSYGYGTGSYYGYGTGYPQSYSTYPSYPSYPSNTAGLSCPPGFTLTTYNGVFGCFMHVSSNGYSNGYYGYNNDYDDDYYDRHDSDDDRDTDLRNFEVDDGDDDRVHENDDDAEIMDIRFDVEDADFRLDKANINFKFTGDDDAEDRPWKVFDRVRLLDDGDEIGSIDASDEDEWKKESSNTYQLKFDDLDDKISEGDSAHLTLEADIRDDIDGADDDDVSFDLYVPDDGISGRGENGDSEHIGDDSDKARVTVED